MRQAGSAGGDRLRTGAESLQLLYLIDSLVPGGSERSLASMAPFLPKLGVSLTVAYLAERPGLQDELRQAGARVVGLEGAGGRLGNAYRAGRLVRMQSPDLIHTTLFEADIAGRTASMLTRVPVVSTLPATMYDREHRADPNVPRWRLAAAQAVDMLTAQRVTRFHAVSGHVAQVMARRLRIPRSRLEVIPRGRDPESLGVRTRERVAAVRDRLSLDASEVLIVAAARQEHKKGLDVLLEALPLVLREAPRARLLIAGREGNQTPLLRHLVERLGIAGAVAFLGPRTDVPDLLAAADVFVLPSVSEGFPGTLVEAMALEAPIVASDLPATREIAPSEDLAWFVPVRRPDLLAAAITAAVSDRDDAVRRTVAARERFMESFTVEQVARRMAAFYRRALGIR